MGKSSGKKSTKSTNSLPKDDEPAADGYHTQNGVPHWGEARTEGNVLTLAPRFPVSSLLVHRSTKSLGVWKSLVSCAAAGSARPLTAAKQGLF